MSNDFGQTPPGFIVLGHITRPHGVSSGAAGFSFRAAISASRRLGLGRVRVKAMSASPTAGGSPTVVTVWSRYWVVAMSLVYLGRSRGDTARSQCLRLFAPQWT